MQPVTNPQTVAMPCALPLVILCTKTKIISGPGEIASAAEANANDMSMS